MSKRLLSCACWLMLLAVPLQTFAADAVGIMSSSTGNVLVDNRPVSAGAVSSGALVETRAGSKAVVTGSGKIVSLGENSSVRLGEHSVDLESGAVIVSSTGKLVTHIEDVTVTTDSAVPSRFLARKINGAVQVLTLKGTVYVSDGQQTTPVPATTGVDVSRRGKDKDSTTSTPKQHAKWLTNEDIGILIVVAAAVTAGVVVGVVNAHNSSPTSPSAP